MYKSKELVEFVCSMVGMPYWYGTCVYKCSTSLLNSKAKQYPSYYASSRMTKYNASISAKKVCMDCVGMIKGFFWTNGGTGVLDYINGNGDFTNKYGSNGCPDKSANGMLTWCKSKGVKFGKISDLPDVPGILLFSAGHVGVYIGDGYAVEARGFNYGVVKTEVKRRSWTSWAYMPLLDYGDVSDPDTSTTVPPTVDATKVIGSRTLRKGCDGSDVKCLQEYLIKLGFNLPKFGADGDYGNETMSAVKEFQKKYGLEVDGVYGKKSHAQMLVAIQ